jgi:hypothetical protein
MELESADLDLHNRFALRGALEHALGFRMGLQTRSGQLHLR